MAAKGSGEQRPASATKPAVVMTSDGPVLVYRLPCGKVGIRHPPGVKVLRKGEPIQKPPTEIA